MTSRTEERELPDMEALRRKWALAERKRAVDNLMWKCCVNCEYYTQVVCLKWNAAPPPTTLVVGCEEYIEHIPF